MIKILTGNNNIYTYISCIMLIDFIDVIQNTYSTSLAPVTMSPSRSVVNIVKIGPL